MTPVAEEQSSAIEEVKPMTLQQQIREEAENLETPQESIAFLRYMQKHAIKVQRLQKRLSSFSSALFAVACGVAGYAAFCYMTAEQVSAAPSGHKLGASREESNDGLSQMFSGMSVMIWSLIAAKAKTGMSASQNGQEKTVAGSLKSAGTLIVLIACAAGFNIYAQMDESTTAAARPTLQAGHHSELASSSRGRQVKTAKNVPSLPARKTLEKEPIHKAVQKSKDIPSFANIDLILDAEFKNTAPVKASTHKAVKSAKSSKHANIDMILDSDFKVDSFNKKSVKSTKSASKHANIDMLRDSFKTSAVDQKLKNARSQAKFQQVGAFLLFVLTSGISLAYYVTFKTYHASLAKMDSLKKLLTNPKARVAAGKTGKDILARIDASKKKAETPKKIVKSTKANETVDLLNQLIEARQTEKAMGTPLLEEEEPVKVVKAAKGDDTMETIKKLLAQRAGKKEVIAAPKVEATIAPQVMYQMPPAGAMPVMQYPVFQAAPQPIAAPVQMMPTPVAQVMKAAPVSAPKKADALADLSKQDLIKLLLTQLAKPDLEA